MSKSYSDLFGGKQVLRGNRVGSQGSEANGGRRLLTAVIQPARTTKPMA